MHSEFRHVLSQLIVSILNIAMTSQLCRGWSDSDEIWYTLLENHMSITAEKSKSKPEVEVSRQWIPKFSISTALDLVKPQTWPNQKPEVDLRRYGRHRVKSIWRHNSVSDGPIQIKFVTSVQNHMPMRIESSKSKPEVEFTYFVRLFSKCESSNISSTPMD